MASSGMSLNEDWFTSLMQVRAVIGAWRQDYDRRKSLWDKVRRRHTAHWIIFCHRNSQPAESNIGRFAVQGLI
jgi:hypothetical protein